MSEMFTTIGKVCLISPPKSEVSSLHFVGNDLVSFLPMEDLGIGVKHIRPSKNRCFSEVSGSYTYYAEGDILYFKSPISSMI